ncbi:MAG: Mut7-C RNAse domain-containing protein, partial [Terriglobia bacterium]
IADAMLGRLGRWLRFLGYDTAYIAHIPDPVLVRKAQSENRTILTRDTLLMKRRLIQKRIVKAVLIKSQVWQAQLSQVIDELGLIVRADRPFEVCPACNGRIKKVGRKEASGRVPEFVERANNEFGFCEDCERYYWPGTHVREIRRKLGPMAGGAA